MWQLLRVWPYSIKEFFEVLHSLHHKEWIAQTQQGWSVLTLTEKGRARIETTGTKQQTVCSQCEGRGLHLPAYWLDLFKTLTQNRPLPIAQYDQGFVRAEDTIARVAFLYRMGDLVSRDILLIGDDDLVSVAIAITGLARRIVVIEVDDRLVQFIENLNQAHHFPIESYRLDVRQPLPDHLRGRFDVFLTDPVETLPALELFLSRGVSSLRGEHAAGYFGLTTLSCSLKKWHKIESLILQMNLVLTDILRDFQIYPEQENQWQQFYESYEMMSRFALQNSLPDTDWYRSSFIRVEAIDTPQPTIKEHCNLSTTELYFDEESLATPRI